MRKSDEDDEMHFGQALVVSRESAKAVNPAEAMFDHPARYRVCTFSRHIPRVDRSHAPIATFAHRESPCWIGPDVRVAHELSSEDRRSSLRSSLHTAIVGFAGTRPPTAGSLSATTSTVRLHGPTSPTRCKVRAVRIGAAAPLPSSASDTAQRSSVLRTLCHSGTVCVFPSSLGGRTEQKCIRRFSPVDIRAIWESY